MHYRGEARRGPAWGAPSNSSGTLNLLPASKTVRVTLASEEESADSTTNRLLGGDELLIRTAAGGSLIYPLVVLFGGLGCGRGDNEPSVVDHRVEAASLLDGPPHEGFDLPCAEFV